MLEEMRDLLVHKRKNAILDERDSLSGSKLEFYV